LELNWNSISSLEIFLTKSLLNLSCWTWFYRWDELNIKKKRSNELCKRYLPLGWDNWPSRTWWMLVDFARKKVRRRSFGTIQRRRGPWGLVTSWCRYKTRAPASWLSRSPANAVTSCVNGSSLMTERRRTTCNYAGLKCTCDANFNRSLSDKRGELRENWRKDRDERKRKRLYKVYKYTFLIIISRFSFTFLSDFWEYLFTLFKLT